MWTLSVNSTIKNKMRIKDKLTEADEAVREHALFNLREFFAEVLRDFDVVELD